MGKIKYIRNPEVFMLEQSECEQFKDLDLDACDLKAIPNKVKDFKNIRQLNVSNNLLSDLPFKSMPTERFLKLTANNNKFKNLSAGVSRLRNMRTSPPT